MPETEPTSESQDAFEQNVLAGGDFLRKNQVEKARQCLAKAVEMRPDDIKALGLYGLACFRLEAFDEALPVYQKLIELRPDDASYRLNLGLVFLKLGLADDAIRELSKSRDIDPSQSRAVSYLGLAHARKGDFASAYEAFLRAGQEQLAREMEQNLSDAQRDEVRARIGAATSAAAVPAAAEEPAATEESAAAEEPAAAEESAAAEEPAAAAEPAAAEEAPDVAEASAAANEVDDEPPSAFAAALAKAADEDDEISEVDFELVEEEPATETESATEPESAAETVTESEPVTESVTEPESAPLPGPPPASGEREEEAAEAAPIRGEPESARAISESDIVGVEDESSDVQFAVGSDDSATDTIRRPPPPPGGDGRPQPMQGGLITQAVADALPSAAATSAGTRVGAGQAAPKPVTELATARLIRPEDGDAPFEIGASGVLIIRVRERMMSRTEEVVVSCGELSFEPATRRVRGADTDELFGEGDSQMFVISGEGYLVAGPGGQVFTAVALDDDIIYLSERLVFAFEDQLRWENGHVPGSNAQMHVTQFRGTGCLVLRSSRPLLSLKLASDRVVYIEKDVLAGWIGRVVPRLVTSAAGGVSSAAFVECSGEGVVLIEDQGSAPVA